MENKKNEITKEEKDFQIRANLIENLHEMKELLLKFEERMECGYCDYLKDSLLLNEQNTNLNHLSENLYILTDNICDKGIKMEFEIISKYLKKELEKIIK